MKLLILCLFGSAAWAGLHITVRLVNPQAIPENVLRKAQRLAVDILCPAGVDTTWLECSAGEGNPCRTPPVRREFWLHLLSGTPPRKLSDAAGFAVFYPSAIGTEGYAAVFYRKVLEAAGGEDHDPAVVLGAAMAHEIGHVLLGSKAHSVRGVMRARLRRAEFNQAVTGALRFTLEQSETIRMAWDNETFRCPTQKLSLP